MIRVIYNEKKIASAFVTDFLIYFRHFENAIHFFLFKEILLTLKVTPASYNVLRASKAVLKIDGILFSLGLEQNLKSFGDKLNPKDN